MPTVTSITTTYAGEHAGKWVSAALLSSNTIENGGVEVKPNIKYKEVISKLATGALLADSTCDFTATSTVTKTEAILQPKDLQVNLNLCKTDFVSDWQAIEMGYSAFDVLPKSFQDFLLAHVVAKVAQENEINIWQGDSANAGEFDGFITKLTVDAALPAAQEVAGIAVTSGNVITELGKIVAAVPDTIYGEDDLSIYVSKGIYKAYVSALAALGYVREYQNQKFADLEFEGIRIFVANGMPANTAICARKSNLYFGTGLLNDSQEVRVIDMSDIDGSKNVRVIMRMTGGVQYAYASEIVTYGVTNLAN